jgi:hypothetical protein
VEPMRPELVNRLLHDRPGLTQADIEEYQRLQAERFLVNPLLPKSPDEQKKIIDRENRIKELHRKIYG